AGTGAQAFSLLGEIVNTSPSVQDSITANSRRAGQSAMTALDQPSGAHSSGSHGAIVPSSRTADPMPGLGVAPQVTVSDTLLCTATTPGTARRRASTWRTCSQPSVTTPIQV